LSENGIQYKRAGENIAMGQRTAEAVMNSWMNSTGHKNNILNPNFTMLGVGHYTQNNINYWVQLFISN
ncbi:MAG: CAP domain-containing protein, partial [Treponema sp.]|nr:CAP domain-containing protein [Treponema sp.]